MCDKNCAKTKQAFVGVIASFIISLVMAAIIYLISDIILLPIKIAPETFAAIWLGAIGIWIGIKLETKQK